VNIINNPLLSHKKRFIVKRSFKGSYLYKSVIQSLYPRETSKTYKFYSKLLNKAILSIGVDDIFNIKLLFATTAFVLICLIGQSNIYSQSNEIIGRLADRSAMLFATEANQQIDKKAEKQNISNERKMFEFLVGRFSYNELKQNETVAEINIARDLQNNNMGTQDEEVSGLARRMYNKLIAYYQVKEVDWFGIMMLVIMAFFLPDAYLFLRSYLIKYLIYNEYLQLEVTAIMVGKLEPIKVEEILNVMSENSKYFKRYIDEIRYNYFDVKNGHAKAFESVIEKITNKELRYLMKALQQASESDLKMTIENLENQRNSNKEFRNIKEQSKLKKKDLVGILIILVALVAVCVYAFGPFSGIMNDFNL
jgi:hypothetical protein